jgi:SNF2-related domain/Helicase conserved C-terminal domain/F/Y rich C-terminus/F/Y-rich N-terminus
VLGPFLVICPLSTISHWYRELTGWTTMNVVTYQGTKESRDMIKQLEFYAVPQKGSKTLNYRFNVLLTTYEMFLREDWQDLQRIRWRALVVDEAQRLKNTNSKLLEHLRLCTSDHRVLLTGTPLQNNTQELWTLLNFIEPIKFVSQDIFMSQFGELQSAEQVSKLQHLLRPHLLRRMKEDVERDIPPKEEVIVEVELTNFQKQYYRAMLEGNRGFLSRGCSGQNVPNLMNIVMELRKVCNHPFLINGVEDKECDKIGPDVTWNQYYALLIRSSAKFILLDKLLPKLKEQGHRVLIFSQMVRVLDLLEHYMRYRGYKHERIDGTVRGAARQSAIDRYTAPNSDRFVFLLCTRAGGVGINLATADTVIIFDSDWNPQNDVQAQARAHRIGQTSEVKVYRLLTAKTYEKQMFERTSKKLGLDQAVLGTLENWDSRGGFGARSRSRTTTVAREIDNLLKQGAYDMFSDAVQETEITDEDIDAILGRSKVVRYDDATGDGGERTTSVNFSKATFQTNEQGIDIDDEDFWSKVLPEEQTSATLLQQLSSGELYDDVDALERFWASLADIVQDHIGRWERGRFSDMPSSQNTDILATILGKVAMDDETNFSRARIEQADRWRQLVAPEQRGRRRRGGSSQIERFGSAQASSSSSAGGGAHRGRSRLRRGSAANGADDAHHARDDGDDDDDDDDGDDDDDEDDASSRSRSRSGKKSQPSFSVTGTDSKGRKQWSRSERKRFVEAIVCCGPDRFDLIWQRAALAERTADEAKEFAQHWLRQCFIMCADDDLDAFSRWYARPAGNANVPADVRVERAKRVAGGDNPTIEDDALDVPLCLIDPPYQQHFTEKCKTWARRMREYDMLERAISMDLSVDELSPESLAKRHLTTWWTHQHNYDLLQAAYRYGLADYASMWADADYNFAGHAMSDIKMASGKGSSTWPPRRIMSAHLKMLLERLHKRKSLTVQLSAKARAAAAERAKRALQKRQEVEQQRIERLREVERQRELREQEKAEQKRLRQLEREAERERRKLDFTKRDLQVFRGAVMSYGPANWHRVLALAKLEPKTVELLEAKFGELVAEAKRVLGIDEGNDKQQTAAAFSTAAADDNDDDDGADREEDVKDDSEADASSLYQFELSPGMARRLLTRLTLWEEMAEALEHENLGEHIARAHRLSMPHWWESPAHDRELLEKCAEWGLSADAPEWVAYLKTDDAIFYARNSGGDAAVVPAKEKRTRAAFLRDYVKDRAVLVDRLHYLLDLILRPLSGGGPSSSSSSSGPVASSSDALAATATETAATATRTARAATTTSADSRKRERPTSNVGDRAPKRSRYRDVAREVRRDADGEPILPFNARGALIESLGEIDATNPTFHNRNYIFPVGFRCSRQQPSLANPSRQARVIAEIKRGPDGNCLFSIETEDGLVRWEHTTPSGAWQRALRALKRRQNVSVSGPEMLGLAVPTVQKLIQDLPNANACAKYHWKTFTASGQLTADSVIERGISVRRRSSRSRRVNSYADETDSDEYDDMDEFSAESSDEDDDHDEPPVDFGLIVRKRKGYDSDPDYGSDGMVSPPESPSSRKSRRRRTNQSAPSGANGTNGNGAEPPNEMPTAVIDASIEPLYPLPTAAPPPTVPLPLVAMTDDHEQLK